MTEKTETLRLSVDSETKELLEEFTKAFEESLVNLVKQTDLTRDLQATEASLHTQVKTQANLILRAAEATQRNHDAIEQLVHESVSRIQEKLQENSEAVIQSNQKTLEICEESRQLIDTVLMTAEQLNEAISAISRRMESLEGQAALLKKDIAKANRPWWQKLFG